MCVVFQMYVVDFVAFFFLFQAEDGIRDLVRSRGLGDVYKRQLLIGEGTAEIQKMIIGRRLLEEYKLKG